MIALDILIRYIEFIREEIMAFTKETYTAPTYTKTEPGLGIMCDNVDIYCDSEKYFCDGAIIMRNFHRNITTVSKNFFTTEQISNLTGYQWYNKESY